ncbi:MAG: class I SAM-dependent methyltransferase, partial [Dehalococcoidia bacterium]
MSFAPELSNSLTGFDPDVFATLESLEEGNFWFLARNALILLALKRHAPQSRSFLEIGCGTGFVLRAVAEAFPDWALSGSELHASGLAVARRRLGTKAEFLQLDARRLPFEEEFDAIGAFDVLEHIEEDESVLASVAKALRPGGLFIATVPQHRSLWSPTDDLAHHVRRYAVGELDRKARACAMTVLMSTSFVTLLLPAMFASRALARRSEDHGLEAEMSLGPAA